MNQKLASMALVAAGMANAAQAFSLESIIDPLVSDEFDVTEQLGDIGRVLDAAARTFVNITIGTGSIINYNTALLIVLGISAVILAVFAIIALVLYLIVSGTTLGSFIGKRSLPDGEEDVVDYNWARILQILDHMEEHFRRLGAAEDNEECRKRMLCQLVEKHGKNNDDQKKLLKLTNELSDIYEKQDFDANRADLRSSYEKVLGYHKAAQQGRKFGQCDTAYPKCPSS